MTEKSEISLQEILVFKHLSRKTWKTHHNISAESGVPLRTVAATMLRFLKLGILDLAEIFPRHHYRLSKVADKRNRSYLQRLKLAQNVFENSSDYSQCVLKNSKKK